MTALKIVGVMVFLPLNLFGEGPELTPELKQRVLQRASEVLEVITGVRPDSSREPKVWSDAEAVYGGVKFSVVKLEFPSGDGLSFDTNLVLREFRSSRYDSSVTLDPKIQKEKAVQVREALFPDYASLSVRVGKGISSAAFRKEFRGIPLNRELIVISMNSDYSISRIWNSIRDPYHAVQLQPKITVREAVQRATAITQKFSRSAAWKQYRDIPFEVDLTEKHVELGQVQPNRVFADIAATKGRNGQPAGERRWSYMCFPAVWFMDKGERVSPIVPQIWIDIETGDFLGGQME